MEFFSGEANVFAEVKKQHPGTAIDIEYMKGICEDCNNAFGMLTASGLGLLVMQTFTLSSLVRRARMRACH